MNGLVIQISNAGVAILSVLSLILALGPQAPIWIQPTCVGLLWGGQFFVGVLLGSYGRGNLITAILAAILLYSSILALEVITDIGASDCMLFSACIMSAGWIVGNRDRKIRSQISIWDLGFFTTVVACCCHAIPRLSTHPLLFIAVFVALVGGLLSCWLAHRWVWQDNWTIRNAALTVCPVFVAVLLLLGWSIRADNVWQAVEWVLTGPLNVIASQATLVILLCAVQRLALHHQEKQPSGPATVAATA